MKYRYDIVNILKPWTSSKDYIIAAWEGGSAATNRLDQYSDLDLSLVVQDNQVDIYFKNLIPLLKKRLASLENIDFQNPHGMELLNVFMSSIMLIQ